MTRFLTAASLLALLAACDNQQPLNFTGSSTVDSSDVVTDGDGEPILDDDGDTIGVTEDGIPEPIAFNLVDVDYDAVAQTLEVTIQSLDSTPISAVYERNAALDAPGYVGFSQQEDPLDRFFVGYSQVSGDGDTTGTLVMDGGQFTTFIAGVNYDQENYTPHQSSQPDNGLVAYTGNYIGILNFPDADNSLLLQPTTNPPGSLLPRQPARVTGEVIINADFVDMQINGGVAERTIIGTSVFPGLPTPLLDIGFVPSDITENGTFFGNVQRPDTSVIGNYGGTLGGEQASGVAIGVHLDGDFILELEGEEEFGLIVLTKCGLPGDGPFCPDAQPDFVP
ncbi:MAG: hypothetical protein AAF986_09590 [Pseudomonadota bacterium]